jgi:hypothetical protein
VVEVTMKKYVLAAIVSVLALVPVVAYASGGFSQPSDCGCPLCSH